MIGNIELESLEQGLRKAWGEAVRGISKNTSPTKGISYVVELVYKENGNGKIGAVRKVLKENNLLIPKKLKKGNYDGSEVVVGQYSKFKVYFKQCK